jgi:hypothetical protein
MEKRRIDHLTEHLQLDKYGTGIPGLPIQEPAA